MEDGDFFENLNNLSQNHNNLGLFDSNELISKKRLVDKELFSLNVTNSYPDKRQSEPIIKNAFYNLGFDLTNKRYLSHNDVSHCMDGNFDSFGMPQTNIINMTPTLAISKERPAKFKVRISDEFGQQIYKSSTDSNDYADFLKFDENFIDLSCHQDSPGSSIVQSPIAPENSDDIKKPLNFENKKLCKNCGHNCVKFK